MTLHARFVHTNLIAHDWHALAEFYRRMFGGVTDPEGNLHAWQARS